MTNKAIDYLNNNKEKFLDELLDLLSIPSVSTQDKHKSDILKAANYLKEKFEACKVDTIKVIDTPGNPVIFAEKKVDKNKPTVLVYGHYDVQPPEPLEKWSSGPFDPVIKDGKIFARGASDDKGQMYAHVKAFESLVATNELPCNVKFLIEGEEEVGSKNLEAVVRNNVDLLQSDTLLISDTDMISNENPSITVGIRGIAYLEIEVSGPNRDLHSGMFGGAIGNPINIMCQMIASLKDEQGKITIPGFYNEVKEVSTAVRDEINSAPFDINEFKSELGINDTLGEDGYTTIERLGIRPSLDVNGIWGGYTGEGAKTVIPSKAYAKISMRLVPNQDSVVIAELFEKHIKRIAPQSVHVKVTKHHGGNPCNMPTTSTGYQAAKKAFQSAWNKTPIPTKEGGSIPIVPFLQEILGLTPILMGFGLSEDAIHSPNENFRLFNYYKGIETIIYFYKHFSTLSNPK